MNNNRAVPVGGRRPTMGWTEAVNMLNSRDEVEWWEDGIEGNFASLCALLKQNAVPTETLHLGC